MDLPPHIAAKRGSISKNYGMIALLCALFLSKQGAGEAAEAIEEKMSSEVSPTSGMRQWCFLFVICLSFTRRWSQLFQLGVVYTLYCIGDIFRGYSPIKLHAHIFVGVALLGFRIIH